MSVPMRLTFLAVTFLGTAFILVQLVLGEAHWRSCFEGMLDRAILSTPKLDYPISDPPYRQIDAWGIALNALTRPSSEALMLIAAPMLPAVAAIALARRPWIAIIALAPMLLVLLLVLGDPGSLHDCDRKGCKGCFGVVLLMLFIQLPVSTVVLMGVGLHRLWPLLYRKLTA